MADDKILSMLHAGELKLPEAVRVRLSGLYRLRREADAALQGPVATALEFLGLDPHQPHTIDFDTGVVTPAKSERHGSTATDSASEAAS